MLTKHHSVLDKVYLNDMFVNLFIPISSGLGIAFAIFLWIRVSAVKVRPSDGHQRTENGREYLLEEESRGEAEVGPCRPVPDLRPPADPQTSLPMLMRILSQASIHCHRQFRFVQACAPRMPMTGSGCGRRSCRRRRRFRTPSPRG